MEILDNGRKKRKISTPSGQKTKTDVSRRRRDNERVMLARASVIKEKYRRLLPAYGPPWKEPPRVATHWDHLLSEAAWMWNDIAQERLWKMAAAKRLAHEAVAYKERHLSDHSSASSTEVVTLSSGHTYRDTFSNPSSGKNDIRMMQSASLSSQALRKLQREYETEEMAAIYGFEPDNDFGLLNIRIPTLPCITAPDEAEKDPYLLPLPKGISNRRTNRTAPRPPNVQIPEQEEPMLAPSPIPCRTVRSQEKRRRSEKLHEMHLAMTPRPQRPRRYNDLMTPRLTQSEISVSPTDESMQETPTIEEFLARQEDRLLFFASSEVQGNWHIVSDVMASAGVYMTPEACQKQLESIKKTIQQAQAQHMRPRPQGSTQAPMDLWLSKQLRVKAKDSLKKGITEMLAKKYTPHTVLAHTKKCMKMKEAMNEDSISSSGHISQLNLSKSVVKAMGGRLATPKESWTKVHNQNIARAMAGEFRQRQLDAAEVAHRQNLLRASSSSQPSMNNTDAQSKFQSSQQSPSQLTVSLTETHPWGQQQISGFLNGPSMGSPPTGSLQTPWIPPTANLVQFPPTDNLVQFPTMPNLVQQPKPGPSAMDQSMLPQMRPGLNYKTPMAPPVIGQQPTDPSMHYRRMVRPQPAMPMAGYNQPDQQNITHALMKRMQEAGRQPMTTITGHPSPIQQRMAPTPSPPTVSPGPAPRMPPTVSSGDLYGRGQNVGYSHGSFPMPAIDAPMHPRAPTPRDYPDHAQHLSRQRPHRPFPGFDMNQHMDPVMGMQNGSGMFPGMSPAMSPGMSLRMHGMSPDLMHPSMDMRQGIPANVDPRLHMPQDPMSMVDPQMDPQGEAYPDARRSMQHYPRTMPRPFGK